MPFSSLSSVAEPVFNCSQIEEDIRDSFEAFHEPEITFQTLVRDETKPAQSLRVSQHSNRARAATKVS
jgi:hypothetical protein